MGNRFLVMGDNHGDTESLQRVLDDTAGESFEYVVHVGDLTRAMRHDRELGVEQLGAVEPLLFEFDERAEHGLLWVWGNQDYFGDLDYELDVGTEIPDDGCVKVGGERFTNDPARIESDVILVTHMEHWSRLDHFGGRAHFCGNTHLGRHFDRRLNSAFLQATNPETGEQAYGGYFVVEVGDDGLDVEMRSIGSLERRVCDEHRERGVQFLDADYDCMYDLGDRVLLREMAASAFYGLTGDTAGSDTTEGGSTRSETTESENSVGDDELVEYAVGLWDDPPSGFRADFRTYLGNLEDDRYAPLARADDGSIVVADESYAY